METKLIIKNTQECMNIINSIRENTYPKEKEKYASYISMNYFVKNLHNFDKKDIDIILNDEKLSFSISSKLSYELLENAIKNKTIFSSYSKKWFHNVKINQALLEQYLPILLKSNDNKQIEDFCNANPVLSKAYYKKNQIENYTFEKYVIGNNPSLISKKMLLSEEDVIDLFKNKMIKYENLKESLNQYSYKFQTIVTVDEIKKLLKYNLDENNKEEKEELLNLISGNSLFFVKRLQQLEPEFTKKLLSSKGKIFTINNSSTSLNFLQSIILEESVMNKSFEDLMVIALYDYKDILLGDIKCSLGIMKHTYTKNYFINLYENNNSEVLKCLALFNKELNAEQKDIVLNGCFEGIISSYENAKLNPDFNINFTQIKSLLQFPYESLLEKINELKKLDVEEKIISELEKYFLYNKLNENLNESKMKEKKIKI